MRANSARPAPIRTSLDQGYASSRPIQTLQRRFDSDSQTIQYLSHHYDLTISQPSPAEPLFTPLRGFNYLSLLSPYAQVPSARYHFAEPHHPTAFRTPFTFFNDFPLEIREKVYDHLLDDFVVKVDGSQNVAVSVLMLRPPIEQERSRLGHLVDVFSSARSMQRPRTNFLTISKQFFTEVRDIIYRRMSVSFERRWDFVNAYINGTLHPNVTVDVGFGHGAHSLFPRGTDVFSHMRSLHLNLSRHSDFDDKVYSAEARRVTTQMLHIVERNMPQLKKLSLMVDQKSRCNSFDLVYVPDPWFLDALVRIAQLEVLEFHAGPGWNGFSHAKRNARNCMTAINFVLATHYRNEHPGHRINPFGETGKLLQRSLAKKMLIYLSMGRYYRDTAHDMSFAVAALDAQVI